jgi:hypothetical protein
MEQDHRFIEQRAVGRQLLTLGQAMSGTPIKCDEADDLGVMSILFAAKQVGHFETISLVLDAGRYADATIMARVMLEGMALLAWAWEDPDDRPRKWRAYSLVFDLRLMREKQQEGESIPVEEERELIDRLNSTGRMFLRRADADPGDVGAYHKVWHVDRNGHAPRVSEIIRKVDDGGLIAVYGSLSNWIHWNAKGLARGIHREQGRVRIRWDGAREAGAALTGGFQALHLSLRALNQHFELGRSEELADLRNRFLLASGIQAV